MLNEPIHRKQNKTFVQFIRQSFDFDVNKRDYIKKCVLYTQ